MFNTLFDRRAFASGQAVADGQKRFNFDVVRGVVDGDLVERLVGTSRIWLPCLRLSGGVV
jgi:hypothetical protein